MLHPVLTIAFDLLLIGTAAAIIATMVREARRLSVGATRVRRTRPVVLAARRPGSTKIRRVA